MVGFILGRWHHSGSPWGSLCSSWDVGFTRVRYWCRWVHPGSLDSLGLAPRWVHSGSLGTLKFALVSFGSSRVIEFTRVRAGGRWVHPGLLCSLRVVGFALGVVVFFLSRCVNLGSPWGSLGSFGVFGFIRIRAGCRWVHPG